MKIYLSDRQGDLILQTGSSLMIEFAQGQRLDLTESPKPLPNAVPEGFRLTAGHETPSPLTIAPVAANGVVVSPGGEPPYALTLFIVDQHLRRQPVNAKKAVLALSSGRTVEVMEDYAQKGLLIWGGREPLPGLTLEQLKARTDSLGIYPLAANMLHLFPWRPK